MKKSIFTAALLASFAAMAWIVVPSFADDVIPNVDAPAGDPSAVTGTEDPLQKAKEMTPNETPEDMPAVSKPKQAPKTIDRADAFLAGPDWDFDGFVAGGQGAEFRSMFYLNDLIYLNIGSQHGISVGDRIGIYKRGAKVNDPDTGKFIGYEVRRAAYARVTDRIEDATCAVRIKATYEAVEIGDLVRREQ